MEVSMPYVGQEIENPRTGQRMVFLVTGAETGGELLRIECFSPPTGTDEPTHVHPRQESHAEVISGRLRFRVDGEFRDVGPGETQTIAAGVPHSFGNHGAEPAHWIQEFRPALRIADFFEWLFALGDRGELDEHGMPSLLQLALSAPVYAHEIRVTRPPWPIQRAAFALLAPIARRRGLHP
jgi:quercetin dioxygenase-like cupin family protein